MTQIALSANTAAAALRHETVLSVRRWGGRMFSFTTTRNPSFRFESGQFVMIGLTLGGRAVLRAYSLAGASYEDQLDYLSIVAPDGVLTPALARIAPGDRIIVGSKPTGTLLLADLLPGSRLYLLATGTGLAPFLSIIRDPLAYERFERIILVHGVRHADELAYRDHIQAELPAHPLLGAAIRRQLVYCPTVTRDAFPRQARIPALIESGRLAQEFALPPLDPATDRVMLCGSPEMVAGLRHLLDRRGFAPSRGIGQPGDYVYERAFAEAQR